MGDLEQARRLRNLLDGMSVHWTAHAHMHSNTQLSTINSETLINQTACVGLEYGM